MYPEFNAQSSQPIVVRKGLSDEHMISHPSLGADGFNNWWRKTEAQNIAAVAEASDLMHAHRLINSACQLRARQVKRISEDRHVRS